jgi:hypothetical protein
VPAVASLYELVARSGSRKPPPGLALYFEHTFLDHPWADPDIPSLVYVDEEGRVAGFLGSSVRRMVLDGEPIRAAVSGQLVTEPRVRASAAGMFLMREYIRGPQDVTVTDTASAEVRRIWERLGGDTVHLLCVGWARVFRPLQFAGDYLGRREASGRTTAAIRVARGLDRVTTPLVARGLRAPRPDDATSEALTPRHVVEGLQALASGFRLQPAYDEHYLEWLFAEMAAITARGELVRQLVRGNDGRVLGWYLYYLERGAIAQALQVAAAERDAGSVLDALLRDAQERGAAGVQGRVEAHLLEPLRDRKCLLHPSGYLALIHSSRDDVLSAIHSGRSLLTRADADWWMGHHLQPFD